MNEQKSAIARQWLDLVRFATEGTKELPAGFLHDAVDDAYFRALLSLFRRPASPERDELLTRYRHGHQRDKWNLMEVRETWKQQDELRRSTGERVTAILKAAGADPAQWLKDVFDVFGVLLGEQPGGTTAKMLGDVWARLQPGAKKKAAPKAVPQKSSTPTQAEVAAYMKAYCDKKGVRYDEREAEKCYNNYEANGWKQKGGNRITNWKAAVRNWMLRVPEFQREMKQQDSVFGSDASYDLAAFTKRAVGLQD